MATNIDCLTRQERAAEKRSRRAAKGRRTSTAEERGRWNARKRVAELARLLRQRRITPAEAQQQMQDYFR